MFRNSYQRGALCIFHSGGAKPFEFWDVKVKDGYLERYLDQDIKKMVIEIGGTNVSTTYMTCPKGKKVLGISMPFLIMTVKNLKKYFTFEVTILDNTNTRRRFRVANFQSTTQILPFCTAMPICLADGWNQIQFNLAEFTNRAYKREYLETQNLKINASIRIRQIYFAERLLSEDELPPLLQLHLPLPEKRKTQSLIAASAPKPSLEKVNKSETQVAENVRASTSSLEHGHKTSKEPLEPENGNKAHWTDRKGSLFTKKKERRASFSPSQPQKKELGVTKESLERIQEDIERDQIIGEIIEQLCTINLTENITEAKDTPEVENIPEAAEYDVVDVEENLLEEEKIQKDDVSYTNVKDEVEYVEA